MNMMKRCVFLSLFLLASSYLLHAGEIDDKSVVISKQPKLWQTFCLSEVRLLPGSPFYHAMLVSQQYLLDADIERMLNGRRKEVGIPEKKPYPGSNQPQGTRITDWHHYVSGTSLMYAQTGDTRFLDRVNYLIDELTMLDARKDSLYRVQGKTPELPYAKLMKGELVLNNPDEAGYPWGGLCWIPFYWQHKEFAAYRDAYLYCNNTKALRLWIKQAEPVTEFILKVNPDLFEGFLDMENGGINAVFADLYALTGDERYMAASMKLNHQKVILNIANGKDVLYGRHANFHLPAFEGTARQYQLTGDEVCRKATQNFAEIYYKDHMNCIGGNGCYERFGRPGEITKRLGSTSSETCNTYNMMKIALNTFESTGDLRHMDYFERAIYNHILASQDPETGGVTYYTMLLPGGFKSYSDRFNIEGIWCCVGTGMENHSKYGEGIYFNNHQSLYVNLFIPSELNWKEKNLHLKQETDFPQGDCTTLTILESGSYDHPIYIRYPHWAGREVSVRINGEEYPLHARAGEYIRLQHPWKTGDRIQVEMKQTFRLEAAPDDPFMNVIFRGPVAYAAQLGSDHIPNDHIKFSRQNNAFRPLDDIPLFIVNKMDLESWLKADKAIPQAYRTQKAGILNGKPKDVLLRPYYQTHHQRYSLYLNMYTPEEMAYRKRVVSDELRTSSDTDEKAHRLMAEKSEKAPQAVLSNVWEATRLGRMTDTDGWFSYQVKVNPDATQNYLVVTYWGTGQENHDFDILIDGQKIATECLMNKHPLTFYEEIYKIPADMTDGKEKVTVRFQSHPGKKAGAVFALKVTTEPDLFPGYSFYL